MGIILEFRGCIMTRFLSALLVTSLCLALAVPADSYDTQLDSWAVREAYFLGRRGHQKISEFLEASSIWRCRSMDRTSLTFHSTRRTR
jgi:hypothetical protein